MADITKCTSNKCPMRASCYRIKAKEGFMQSWANFESICNENNGYSVYIGENNKNINKKSKIIKANFQNP